MWSGHLIDNFVYNPARSSNPLTLVTWLIARDIHTAASVSRWFYWTNYNLWPDYLPARSLFVLSGRDELVPVKHVEQMVKNQSQATLMLHPKHSHASIVFDPAWQDEVVCELVEVRLWLTMRGCCCISALLPALR